ncbi:MAG: choline-sulfatase [Planctomycetota bacterium]
MRTLKSRANKGRGELFGSKFADTDTQLKYLFTLVSLVFFFGCSNPDESLDGARANAGSNARDILLILVDTLRADRLGCYGNDRPVSPNIDALAKRGVRFEETMAPAPWTLPSTASLFTGLTPGAHGAGTRIGDDDGREKKVLGLSPEIPTLAKRLSNAGYETAAFVTNPFLTCGLEQGFDTFEHRDTEGADVSYFAEQTLRKADRARPLFMLLHFMDCHDPLLYPDEDAKLLTESGKLPPDWSRTFGTLIRPSISRPERLLAYDAAIHYVDRQVGRIIASVEESDRGRETLFVLTSDHGEEVFEHIVQEREPSFGIPENHPPGLGHGQSLFKEVIHVPLIFSGSGIAPNGVITSTNSLLDVTPTVLEMVGVPFASDSFDGGSLLGVIAGEAAAPSNLLITSIRQGRDQRALITDRWKLIVNGHGDAAPIYLFDRTAAEIDRHDLSAEYPEVVVELRQELLEREANVQGVSGVEIETDSAMDARLNALGYTED